MATGVDVVHHWWAQAIRGVVAVLFGLAALIWPGITLLVLLALFGAYALVDGVFAIIAAVRAIQRQQLWWPLMLEGIAGIVAGVAALVLPGITALALLFIIAIWAIWTGVFEIIAGIQMRSWMLGIGGVLSVLFGIVLLAQPAAGALALVWVIGIYAVIFGVLLFIDALTMRSRQQRLATA